MTDWGHRPRASNSNRKLTDEQVRSIRRALRADASIRALAKRYGVQRQVIYSIRNRSTYRDVLDETPQ
jgi:transposase-like protein